MREDDQLNLLVLLLRTHRSAYMPYKFITKLVIVEEFIAAACQRFSALGKPFAEKTIEDMLKGYWIHEGDDLKVLTFALKIDGVDKVSVDFKDFLRVVVLDPFDQKTLVKVAPVI